MEAPTNLSDNEVEQALASLLAASQTPSSVIDSNSSRQLLESKLDGPKGVVHDLIDRLWLPTPASTLSNAPIVQGDHAVSILSYLVERYPTSYMSVASQSICKDVERRFPSKTESPTEIAPEISDVLLMALVKLLIAPNSDDQVRIATDANSALLTLCNHDHYQKNCTGLVAKRMLSSLNLMWRHLQIQKKREYSSAQMRIASLMIDVGLLGDDEFSWALICEGDDNGCIMDKLLYLALDSPNDDPLLQMSALDQLERLTCEPFQRIRAEFLLGNDILRRGLLCLVGSNGDLTKDPSAQDEWYEMDPVNSPASLRVLTEICSAGVSASLSTSLIDGGVWSKFHVLLKNFHRALHEFHPQGEVERLSYIHAVSSLFASCSIVACNVSNESASATTELTNFILRDKTLLHDWLSLHSRASQPKLKSALLCSIAQVMEPTLMKDDPVPDAQMTRARPNDAIVLQLYQAFSEANHNRDPTELVLTSAKSPFEEERLGAYAVLQALVIRGAAVRLLLLYSDVDKGQNLFLEWLLNQENEKTTEGRNNKYLIVHTMLSRHGSLIGGLIPNKMMRELELWNERGPGFTRAVPWEMATE